MESTGISGTRGTLGRACKPTKQQGCYCCRGGPPLGAAHLSSMSPTPQVIESIINSNQKPRIKISYIFVGVPYFVCVRYMDEDLETLLLCTVITPTE